MEDKILEVVGSIKRLPEYVFSKKYHYIYFFEMPMPQVVIQRLITILMSTSASNKYSGILLEPFNIQSRASMRIANEIPEVSYEMDGDEREITWAYNIGYFKGESWEMYYEFNSEVLLVGIEGMKDVFDESIQKDSTLMKYHYPLEDLINYFKSIATSNFNRPLDREFEDFVNKLNFNYMPFASSV